MEGAGFVWKRGDHAHEEISRKVSGRHAKAASMGEKMCCPTSYDMTHLKSFIPEEVLKICYGCGTPAGLNTVNPGETVLDMVMDLRTEGSSWR